MSEGSRHPEDFDPSYDLSWLGSDPDYHRWNQRMEVAERLIQEAQFAKFAAAARRAEHAEEVQP